MRVWWVAAALAACGGRQSHAVPHARDPSKLPDLFEVCRAEAGRITRHWIHLPGPSGHLSGKLYFSYIRTDPYWLPVAFVAVVSREYVPAKPADRAMFRVTAHSHDSDQIDYTDPVALPSVAPSRDIPFALGWTPTGVEFRFSERDVSPIAVPLTFAPTALQITCSTADVVFHAVTITAD